LTFYKKTEKISLPNQDEVPSKTPERSFSIKFKGVILLEKYKLEYSPIENPRET